jgi:Tol biopolymer transport system component
MKLHRFHAFARAITLALVILSGGRTELSAQNCEFRLVDVTPTGQPGNGNTLIALALSGDGRFVVFVSTSSNLVPGDFNGKRDVFLRDLWTGTTELVSVASDGTQTDDVSMVCDVSADGRFVLFATWAKSLDPLDQDGLPDVYVRDRLLGLTEWISKPLTAAPSAWGAGTMAGISDDGRFVAFSSAKPDIITNDTNGAADVFLRDRLLQVSLLVSQSTSGEQGNLGSADPIISADGTRVLFRSVATNLHPSASPTGPWKNHLYLRNLNTGVTQAIDLDSNGNLPRGSIVGEYDLSPDGRSVLFHGDGWLTGNWHYGHVLWREGRPGFQTIDFPNGKPGWGLSQPNLSEDGRYVVFESSVPDWTVGPLDATNVHVHDTLLGVTSVVTSFGPGTWTTGSGRAKVSHDGKVVAFITSDPAFTTLPVNNHDYAVVRLCDVTPGLTFCFPSRSPLGCLPSVTGSGTPSATAGSGHDLDVGDVRNDQIGLFFYGTSGDQALPFGNGWQCLAGPLVRMAVQSTGGAPPPAEDCSGVLHTDFNAWVAGGGDPSLVPGTTVYVQSWSRDPSYGFGSLLSDATAFVLGP